MLLVIWSAINMQSINPISILLILLMLSFYGYSIYCGVLCGDTKENCLRHSRINQLLQLVGFAGFGYAYFFAAGIFISVGADLTYGPDLDFKLGISSMDLQFNTGAEWLKINVNLVAIGLLVWINKTIRTVALEKQFREIKELGQELQPLEP